MTDHDVIDTMLRFGGNFIHHLALAFCAADPVNQQRLKAAFATEWQEYAELAGHAPQVVAVFPNEPVTHHKVTGGRTHKAAPQKAAQPPAGRGRRQTRARQ